MTYRALTDHEIAKERTRLLVRRILMVELGLACAGLFAVIVLL